MLWFIFVPVMRFAMIFGWIYLFVGAYEFIYQNEVSKSFDWVIFVGAVAFTIYTYIYSLAKGLGLDSNKINHSRPGQSKYGLISFNNALAKEIIKIRMDLISLRTKNFYDKRKGTPPEFLNILWLFREYPTSAITQWYRTRNGTSGQVVIILDNHGDFEESNFSEMNMRSLRALHSFKYTILEIGMHFPMFIYEPEFNEDSSYTVNERHAKLTKMSPTADNYIGDVELTFEIYDDWDDYGDESEDNKIIRTFTVDACRHNLAWNEKLKKFYKRYTPPE